MDKADFNYIRDFIIRGKVKEALEELLSILQSSSKRQSQLRDDVIMLRSHFHEVERKESLHLLSSEEASRERAQLQKGILDVINDLEDPAQTPPVRTGTTSGTGSGIQLPTWFFIVGFALVILGFIYIPRLYTLPAETGGPDLVLVDWDFSPKRLLQEQPFTVTLKVLNRGDAAADNFKVEWWAGVNFPAAEQTWLLSLDPGAERVLTYTYPGYSSWYSKLETKVVLDADGQIADTHPEDNVELKEVRVHKKATATPLPDLVAVSIELSPYPPIQGERTRVTVSVQNRGDAHADNVRVQWWAGLNYPEPAQTWTGIDLAAGAREELTFYYPGYPSWYGRLQTKVVVDPDGQIDETNRNNNSFIRTIRVDKAKARAQADQ